MNTTTTDQIKAKAEALFDKYADKYAPVLEPLLKNPNARPAVEATVYLMVGGILAPRRIRNAVRVIQKAAQGEPITKWDGYRLVAGVTAIALSVQSTVAEGNRHSANLRALADSVKKS